MFLLFINQNSLVLHSKFRIQNSKFLSIFASVRSSNQSDSGANHRSRSNPLSGGNPDIKSDSDRNNPAQRSAVIRYNIFHNIFPFNFQLVTFNFLLLT